MIKDLLAEAESRVASDTADPQGSVFRRWLGAVVSIDTSTVQMQIARTTMGAHDRRYAWTDDGAKAYNFLAACPEGNRVKPIDEIFAQRLIGVVLTQMDAVSAKKVTAALVIEAYRDVTGGVYEGAIEHLLQNRVVPAKIRAASTRT